MKLWDYLDKRRQAKEKLMRDIFDKEHQLQERRVKANENVVDKIVNPRGANPCLPLVGRDLLKGNWFVGTFNNNEPFGWKPGTVRGMITIFMVLTFNILVMWSIMTGANFIPIDWYMYIMGIVILSYFVSRAAMKWNGGKQ